MCYTSVVFSKPVCQRYNEGVLDGVSKVFYRYIKDKFILKISSWSILSGIIQVYYR